MQRKEFAPAMTTSKANHQTPPARGSLSRRALMRTGVLSMASVAAWLTVAVSKARAAKFTQKAVFYRPHPSLGQKCSTCRLFRRPNSCRDVTGYISPDGWCVIWRDG